MMVNDAKKIKFAIFAAFFLFIATYGFLRSTDLLFGVKIRNVSWGDLPGGGQGVMITTSPVKKVAGNARNAVHLTLNGRQISVDLEGNFEETIALLPGYNIVSIQATDKFGYNDEEIYKLILEE